MSHFEHPKPEPRHKPTIAGAEVGAQVSCLCGWSAKARTQPAAVRAYIGHLADEKASEGGGS